jgi:hypothetical protein
MLDFLKRKKPDHVEVLTNQAVGGQSVMYRLFREGLGCEDSSICRLELTYFAATVLTFVYLRFGKEPNREQSRSGGTATKCAALPMSMPAAFGWTRLKACRDFGDFRLSDQLRGAMACSIIRCAMWRGNRVRRLAHSLKRDIAARAFGLRIDSPMSMTQPTTTLTRGQCERWASQLLNSN